MKKDLKNKKLSLWDAFTEFMESLYWPGCLDTFTPEEINFNWEEFQMLVSE